MDQLVKENSDGYTFSGTQEGVYTIKVQVSDGSKTTTHEWVLTLIAGWISQQNVTQLKTSVCGNNKEEAGEDCKTCPQDVVCPSDYTCSEEGKCIKEKKPSRWPILLILGIIILITIAIIIIYNKRAERVYSNVAPAKKKKEEPPAEVHDFYKEPKVKKEETRLKKVIEPKKHKTVSSILLKNYINSSIAKKMSTSQIKENLLKKGWDKEEIEKALKEYGTIQRS